ncbi:MAG: ABC transporter ATP-binding protein [Rhodopseudomonas palustris]|uniref:ABC transporter ATP-binding protein n=1 Tax=Rhodopseudomonas palustris TaxID=1076 RepID=A0A933S5Y5_RHOPL|nr:ABC transporter ATP-binding protein [Rhodopseudomonas palustris]
MTAPKLELVDLYKEYGDGSVAAVDGVDLVVEAGETVALLGPSGCGKSSTLNMIVGLEQPTSGDIRIDGKSVVGVPPGRRNVGLVFQDYAVFTHMSVRANLGFGLSVRGGDRQAAARRVEEVAELLGLTSILDEKATRLGGSQLQRVAIGRTLVVRPAVLLLDEPLSNLEAESRQAMRRELRRLQAEIGLTIIYVTHDQIEALSLASKIAVMSSGKIVQFDSTERVYDRPNHVFVAGFMGSPPMNLVRGELAEARFARKGFSLTLPAALAASAQGEGREVTLGIRPEQLRLVQDGAGTLSGRVALVQPRGAEAVVSIETGGVTLQALVAAANRPDEGASVGLAFDAAALTLFSGETGRSLHGKNGLAA